MQTNSETMISASAGVKRSDVTGNDAERLGRTRSDAWRSDATLNNSEQLGVSWSDAERLGTMQCESKRRDENLIQSDSDAELAGVRVTFPDSLPAQHIHPNISGTLRMQRFPPIAHWRVSASEASPA